MLVLLEDQTTLKRQSRDQAWKYILYKCTLQRWINLQAVDGKHARCYLPNALACTHFTFYLCIKKYCRFIIARCAGATHLALPGGRSNERPSNNCTYAAAELTNSKNGWRVLMSYTWFSSVKIACRLENMIFFQRASRIFRLMRIVSFQLSHYQASVSKKFLSTA